MPPMIVDLYNFLHRPCTNHDREKAVRIQIVENWNLMGKISKALGLLELTASKQRNVLLLFFFCIMPLQVQQDLSREMGNQCCSCPSPLSRLQATIFPVKTIDTARVSSSRFNHDHGPPFGPCVCSLLLCDFLSPSDSCWSGWQLIAMFDIDRSSSNSLRATASGLFGYPGFIGRKQ